MEPQSLSIIKTKRKSKGMTLRQVFERTGIPDSSLSKYERGLYTPDIPVLRKLGECYGVDWRELVED